jgi:hypothetical protein
LTIEPRATSDAPAVPGRPHTHRIPVLLLIAYTLVRVATTWHVDEYTLLNADYNAQNIVELARHHDVPPLDDMEAGHLRDTLTFSSLYFLSAWVLDGIGVPVRVVHLLHQALGPPLLAAAMYAIGWALFGSAAVALLAALVLSAVDYAWFLTNVGYPILFNQALYYGDVNHVLAAALLAALLMRRFGLAATASVLLSLMNPTYGLNGVLCLAVVWALTRAASSRMPGLGAVVAISVTGAAAGYGLVVTAMWLAPPDAGAPAVARELAIRSYGHVAIHAAIPAMYIAGIGTLITALLTAVHGERGLVRHGRDPWFERVAGAIAAITVVQGIAVYWWLYVAWPQGFIGTSPSKIFMFAVLFITPYVARGLVLALTGPHRGATVATLVLLAAVLASRSIQMVWGAGLLASAWGAIARRPLVPTGPPIRIAVMAAAAILVTDLGVAMAQPFRDARLALAAELKDISLLIRARLPAQALLVPVRFEADADPRLGPFTNLALRTFSRRGYLPYWSVGRNAYFDSAQRHRAEERALAPLPGHRWPEMMAAAMREREERPLRYFTGLDLRLRPCCAVSMGLPTASRLLADTQSQLERYLATLSPRDWADYARDIGGTHLFVSRSPGAVLPWGPVLAETAHFAVIPVPAEWPSTETRPTAR